MDAHTQSAKTYYAGGEAYLYPCAGDPMPPTGAKVLLLTKFGMCILGHWGNNDTGFFVGWAPLPKRDPQKEAGISFKG